MIRATAALLVLVMTATFAVAAPRLVREAHVLPEFDNRRILTILVIGSDVGPPQRPGNPLGGRADAIHLIAVDTRRARATIVDFPRDSVIAGDKVNAHLSRGGPENLVRVMEGYTNVRIDRYALTSFAGMRRMVDGLGGVTIKLDRAIRDSYSNANLRAGTQRLNGKEALAFARTRKVLSGGDFDRTRNQGRVLIAAQRKIAGKRMSLTEMARLASVFARNTESNIDIATLYELMVLARRVRARNVKQVSLRGSIGTQGGASVVHLFGTDVFRDIRRGKVGQ